MSGIVAAVNAGLRRVPVWPWYLIGFLPAVLWFRAGFANTLGPDPVRALEHEFGLLALQLLIGALAVTRCANSGINLLRFRRMIGLMGFYYVVLHLLVWLVLDRQFVWTQIVGDLTKRPYIIVGMAAFLMLVPLALTSTNWAIRKVGGARWRSIHRLVYPATALAAIHFVWLVKAWPLEPLAYAGGVAALLVYRLVRGRLKARSRGAKAPRPA